MSVGLEEESPKTVEQRSWGRRLAEINGISTKEWETGPSTEETAYREKLQEHAHDLNEAMRQEWIGGYDVQQAMEQVGKLADARNWAKATEKIDAAVTLAAAVMSRKPYVVA